MIAPLGADSYLNSPSSPLRRVSKYSSNPSIPFPSGSTNPIIFEVEES